MIRFFTLIVFFALFPLSIFSQFKRTELPTELQIPWELEYGPDGNLWVSESQGRVVKVNPETGASKIVFTAPDYADAGSNEQWPLCFKPMPGSGCLGMALDLPPGMPNYIYLLYSYRDTVSGNPKTFFKVAKLTLDKNHDTVVKAETIIKKLPTGFDHLGGKMVLASYKSGFRYLFISIGDNGISETAQPSCYQPQDSNPNQHTWDPDYKNGKILRYYPDGSIPWNNPIQDNPFYTRGHRNPQGLAFNRETGVLYECEHGDRTDDEVNILEKGMNYGWKWVRGMHDDNNWPGEADAVANYKKEPRIQGDHLVEPIYTWCAEPQPAGNNNADWCTVAPSGCAWYSSRGISYLQNCLLVTTLKNGNYSRQEVYVFRFEDDGVTLKKSTPQLPNPYKLFEEDANKNGRLRDIAFSDDGKKIFLINNGGTGVPRDRIIVYTFDNFAPLIYPNPATDKVSIRAGLLITEVKMYDATGKEIAVLIPKNSEFELPKGIHGLFYLRLKDEYGYISSQELIVK